MTRAVSGLVLAGGGSRRMGSDKALIEVDGARLVDIAVRELLGLSEDVVVASGPRRIPDLAVAQVPDEQPHLGPLAGLTAGLALAVHPAVIVLACDMPHPDAVLLAGLAARWDGEPALIPSHDGRPQPLHALWSAAVAPALAALLDDGVRSLLHAVELIGATVLDDVASSALAQDPRWATNLNRPADIPR